MNTLSLSVLAGVVVNRKLTAPMCSWELTLVSACSKFQSMNTCPPHYMLPKSAVIFLTNCSTSRCLWPLLMSTSGCKSISCLIPIKTILRCHVQWLKN